MEAADRILAALTLCQQAHTAADGEVDMLYLSTKDAGEILAQAIRARRDLSEANRMIDALDELIETLKAANAKV